jgi:hypothetical protein
MSRKMVRSLWKIGLFLPNKLALALCSMMGFGWGLSRRQSVNLLRDSDRHSSNFLR